MRVPLIVVAALLSTTSGSYACSFTFSREPTVADQIAGVKQIFGGTVIGYVTGDGAELLGAPPRQCLDDDRGFRWWEWENLPAKCSSYLDVSAALFRVDAAIVGPAEGDITSFEMTWGDGDCNTDFNVGERWLVAGFWVQERLTAPIRADEVETLQRLAARPAVPF